MAHADVASIVEAAGSAMGAGAEAARRAPRAAIRSWTLLGLVAIVAAFVWAGFLAPWARASAPAAAASPLTRQDLDDAMREVRVEMRSLGARIDAVLLARPQR